MIAGEERAKIKANFDQIEAEVREEELVAMPMERLRNAYEKKKLGKFICHEISDELRHRGLGHSPLVLPADAWSTVYVLVQASNSERIIRAAHDPSVENAEQLRTAAEPAAAEKIIRQIRELVGE